MRGEVFFNGAFWFETVHMLLAAYIVAGFTVAGVYAVGMLKGRRDHYHRVGFLTGFLVAAVALPVQIFVGDLVYGLQIHEPRSAGSLLLCRRPDGASAAGWGARRVTKSCSQASLPGPASGKAHLSAVPLGRYGRPGAEPASERGDGGPGGEDGGQ